MSSQIATATLFRSDQWMIDTARRKLRRGLDVFDFKVRQFFHDLGVRKTGL